MTMATVTLTLRGDQIGRFSRLTASGNGADRVVQLRAARAIGTANQTYTVIVEQVADGTGQFANGQFITILGPTGNVVMARTNVQPDLEQGRAAGDEHLIIPSRNIVIDVGGLPLTSTTVVYDKTSEAGSGGVGDNDGELDFADVRTNFPCFSQGTRIMTPGGECPVEALRDGDRLVTRDGGVQPILWIRARTITFKGLDDPRRPIRVAAHAFGARAPHSTLDLSPQHRVLARHADTQAELLVPVKGLCALPGFRVRRGRPDVRYHSILMPRHQIIMANGLWCESVYPARYMLTTLEPALRAELLRLFPLLRIDASLAYGPPARPFRTVGETRVIAPRLMPQIGWPAMA